MLKIILLLFINLANIDYAPLVFWILCLPGSDILSVPIMLMLPLAATSLCTGVACPKAFAALLAYCQAHMVCIFCRVFELKADCAF